MKKEVGLIMIVSRHFGYTEDVILATSGENLSSGFPTRSDTNLTVHPQKMIRGLKFRILKLRDCTIYVTKTKALISFMVRAFVSAYAKSRFSHDAANITEVGAMNLFTMRINEQRGIGTCINIILRNPVFQFQSDISQTGMLGYID